jgi:SAM-dependent methyltransferase
MRQRAFSGDVVDYYARYRRGFPPAVVDTVVEAAGLTRNDLVLDLGCGTGQLTLPLADRVRTVVGVDPEPDMLARARALAEERGVTNASWVLGADRDLAALGAVLGERALGAVTIATAIHLMDHDRVFRDALRLLRPGGAVAVIANGLPLWLYDTDWSRAVRECMFDWFGATPEDRARPADYCGLDATSRAGYRSALVEVGYDVDESAVEYEAEFGVEELIGNLLSSMGTRLPSPAERLELGRRIREAVHPRVRFPEPVRVATLIGRVT